MFKLFKIENAGVSVPEPEYITVPEGMAIVGGEALNLNGGEAALCTGSSKPAYIALGKVDADAKNRTLMAARVTPDQIYEVPLTAGKGSLTVGSTVQIESTALSVNSSTTATGATIVSFNGFSAVGDKILVRFK